MSEKTDSSPPPVRQFTVTMALWSVYVLLALGGTWLVVESDLALLFGIFVLVAGYYPFLEVERRLNPYA